MKFRLRSHQRTPPRCGCASAWCCVNGYKSSSTTLTRRSSQRYESSLPHVKYRYLCAACEQRSNMRAVCVQLTSFIDTSCSTSDKAMAGALKKELNIKVPRHAPASVSVCTADADAHGSHSRQPGCNVQLQEYERSFDLAGIRQQFRLLTPSEMLLPTLPDEMLAQQLTLIDWNCFKKITVRRVSRIGEREREREREREHNSTHLMNAMRLDMIIERGVPQSSMEYTQVTVSLHTLELACAAPERSYQLGTLRESE